MSRHMFKNFPSVVLIILALVTTDTRSLPFAFAYSKARRAHDQAGLRLFRVRESDARAFRGTHRVQGKERRQFYPHDREIEGVAARLKNPLL